VVIVLIFENPPQKLGGKKLLCLRKGVCKNLMFPVCLFERIIYIKLHSGLQHTSIQHFFFDTQFFWLIFEIYNGVFPFICLTEGALKYIRIRFSFPFPIAIFIVPLLSTSFFLLIQNLSKIKRKEQAHKHEVVGCLLYLANISGGRFFFFLLHHSW